MTKTLVVTLALLAAPAVALAAEPQMTAGLWEISASMDMPSLPFKLPAQKVQHCYTKEEIARAESAVPQQQQDCRVEESRRVGNKLTWKVVCTGKNAGKGEGEIVFTSATSYDGWMRFDSSGAVMTTRYTAKRLGDCK
jgi:hypothetical protein